MGDVYHYSNNIGIIIARKSLDFAPSPQSLVDGVLAAGDRRQQAPDGGEDGNEHCHPALVHGILFGVLAA